MAVRLSASFYKATIDKFSQVANDPLAFPILLSFLDKASQSADLLQSSKKVISDEEQFSSFFKKMHDNLPPAMARIIQKQEVEIREKLRPAIEAEMHKERRLDELETELKLRKEFEARADKKEQEQREYERSVIGKMIQLELENQQKIDAMTKRHDDFVMETKKQAEKNKKHTYIGYAATALGVGVSVAGLPYVWNWIVGKLPDPSPLAPQIRFASSGQCLPSDVKVEVNKDGLTTLPSSGTVCLAFPENSAPNNTAQSSFVSLPYNEVCGLFSGKSWLDILNDGNTVKLYKQDGSSICLHMPSCVPSTLTKKPETGCSHKKKEPNRAQRGNGQHYKRHQPKRCP